MSLLEIIVYAALSLILIALAMSALSTVEKGVSKSSQTGRMQGEADEAVQVMGRDLRNLGLKRLFYASSPGVFVDTLLTKASYLPTDSSSFNHRDGSLFDTLTFLRARIDAEGKPTGVDTITYSVNPADQVLSRTVKGATPTTVCTRVEALQFDYGISAQKILLVNENPPTLGHWTSVPSADLTLVGSSLVASKSAAGTVTFWQSTTSFSTSAMRRYVFDLQGMADGSLLTNLGSMSVMVCSAGGTIQASETFKVGTTATDLRIELDVPACVSCRAGVQVNLLGAGKLFLSKFSFTEVSQGDFTWSSAPTLAQRKSMRAVRIYLLIGSDKAMYGNHGNSLTLANAALSFSDGKGRSLLDEVIPTPNNGP